MNKLEIPAFNEGDIVTDKFGNLFEIHNVVFTERFNHSAEYGNAGYCLKID